MLRRNENRLYCFEGTNHLSSSICVLSGHHRRALAANQIAEPTRSHRTEGRIFSLRALVTCGSRKNDWRFPNCTQRNKCRNNDSSGCCANNGSSGYCINCVRFSIAPRPAALGGCESAFGLETLSVLQAPCIRHNTDPSKRSTFLTDRQGNTPR